jgi:hypothetical protein
VQRSFQSIGPQGMTSHVQQVQVFVTLEVMRHSTSRTAVAMPVRRVVRNAQRPRPSALDRPPYPPAQARAIADASTSHSADPVSCDPAQPPDPIPLLRASSAADIVSMDDVSGGTAARDSPRGPTDWAACNTRNEDEQGQVQPARRPHGCVQPSSSCWNGPGGTGQRLMMSAHQPVCITQSCRRSC